MGLLIPQRKFDPATPEFTDRDNTDPVGLRDELRMLQVLNARSQGHGQALRCLEQLVNSPVPSPLRILDLGTGAADVPRAVVAWARQRGLPVAITAVDRNPAVLDCARGWSAGFPEIQFEQQDVLRLPYEPQSFDIVMSSLMLHHFTAANAVTVLRSLRELARVGYILNDLRRNWAATFLVDLLAARYIKNPMTLHDAKASCHAAFSVGELRELAQRAGMTDFCLQRHNGVFRMALVGRK